MNKFNKGEWSEIYAKLKILCEPKVSIGDENLNPTKEYLKILKVFFTSTFGNCWYKTNTNGRVEIQIDRPIFVKISNDDISQIFQQIQNSKGPSFAIAKANDLIKKMHIHKIKTNSHTKGDVRLIFMLSSSNLINDEEFSIKSGMGSDPSLLNAAKTTNFTYLLKNNISEYQNINSIDSHSKIRDRLQRIISKADIEYSYNDSFIFENNLRMLDSFLPEIVSRILLKFFLTGQRKISKLVSMIDTKFERINLSTAQIEFKIKKLLNAIALGMVPGIEWDGKKIGGGCLFIKRTGELVGYTLYNEDIFNELLFNLSYLDTASTSRHNFGSIYKNKNNKQEFKLNFYLRLKI